MGSISPFTESISTSLQIQANQVKGVIALLEEGSTIPFIARYRKESTGSLDEVQIARIRDELHLQQEMAKRREAILSSLEKLGELNSTLKLSLENAGTLAAMEDIYLPYRPKRRTRAAIAREAGLEPLADLLHSQSPGHTTSLTDVLQSLRLTMPDDEALAGARDIIAERVSEHQQTRESLRQLFRQQAVISSSLIEKRREEAEKYRDYFDCQEAVPRIAGHRLLAMLRGENEKYLSLSFRPDPEKAVSILYRLHITKKTGVPVQMRLALEDAYSRLLAPSLENELKKN